MATLRIEDDDDQLKVPRDQIPPVRPRQEDAADAGSTQSAARQLIGTPPVSPMAPAANAPRQIPGLALRASLAKSTGSRKDTP
jgi:hypothetical protein